MGLINFIDLLLVISAFLSIVLPVFFRLKNPTKRRTSLFKKLTIEGKIFAISCSVMLLLGVLKIFFIPVNFSSEKPIVDVLSLQRGNPIIVKDSVSNTYQFIVSVGTITPILAYNIRDEMTLINYLNNSYVDGGTTISPQTNESMILDTTSSLRLRYTFYADSKEPKTNLSYFYLKILYDNVDGIQQPPLRKIYRANIKNLKEQIPEVNYIEYEKIKNMLKKRKKW